MGKPLPENDRLRDRAIKNSGYVADTYASAWHSVLTTDNFQDAMVDAINRGGDADTVGAVTGMIAGRLYGCKAMEGLADQLVSSAALRQMGKSLWK